MGVHANNIQPKRINVVLICHLSQKASDPFTDKGLVSERWLVSDANGLSPVTFYFQACGKYSPFFRSPAPLPFPQQEDSQSTYI